MTILMYLLIGALFAVNSILAGIALHVGKTELLSFTIIAILNAVLWPVMQTAALIGIIIYCKKHVPPQKVDLVFIDDTTN